MDSMIMVVMLLLAILMLVALVFIAVRWVFKESKKNNHYEKVFEVQSRASREKARSLSMQRKLDKRVAEINAYCEGRKASGKTPTYNGAQRACGGSYYFVKDAVNAWRKKQVQVVSGVHYGAPRTRSSSGSVGHSSSSSHGSNDDSGALMTGVIVGSAIESSMDSCSPAAPSFDSGSSFSGGSFGGDSGGGGSCD
jgi:hypothetical protein